VASAIVDTGAVVALVNRDDRFHDNAVAGLRVFRGSMLTTDAVVTETAYVLAATPPHQRAASIWFERARAARLLLVEPIADYAALTAIIARHAEPP
jgi:predicted nucleic acid-binding protein